MRGLLIGHVGHKSTTETGNRMKPIGSGFVVTSALVQAVASASQGETAVDVLSNRRDLVSGGDVLIEVVLPLATPPSSVVLLSNGSPATAEAGLDGDGRYLARITGLALGSNTLTAQVAGVGEA